IGNIIGSGGRHSYPWSLLKLQGLARFQPQTYSYKEITKSKSGSNACDDIERFCQINLLAPIVLLVSLPLIIFGSRLNSHGIDRASLKVTMIGWVFLAVGF